MSSEIWKPIKDYEGLYEVSSLGRIKSMPKKFIRNGAVTHFEVIERFENYTLVRATLETGRTHQIRVHAASLNHPLLGDPLYGPKTNKLKVVGQTLHAKKLGFIHPSKNEYVEFNSELPEYFQKIINRIK